jgi:hypothetical protein
VGVYYYTPEWINLLTVHMSNPSTKQSRQQCERTPLTDLQQSASDESPAERTPTPTSTVYPTASKTNLLRAAALCTQSRLTVIAVLRHSVHLTMKNKVLCNYANLMFVLPLRTSAPSLLTCVCAVIFSDWVKRIREKGRILKDK